MGTVRDTSRIMMKNFLLLTEKSGIHRWILTPRMQDMKGTVHPVDSTITTGVEKVLSVITVTHPMTTAFATNCTFHFVYSSPSPDSSDQRPECMHRVPFRRLQIWRRVHICAHEE